MEKEKQSFFYTEVNPGVYKRESKFKLKTHFVAYKQYKEIDVFGWKIHARINSVIESMKKVNKTVINDTDKNMSAVDLDTSDIIF